MNDPELPRRTLSPWWLLAVVFGAGWVAYLVFFLPRTTGPTVVSGQPAEFGWQLLDLDDGKVPFRRFQGKPIFLNIWATWCPPCVGEMPSIARLASRPELNGVAFVCVSADDSGQTVKRFLEGKNWPMTVLRATDAPKVFATDGIPATFIIAPNGTIASADVGSRDWDSPETVSLLRRLLKETPSKP
ncbi:MAG: TlpA disulfide reductase family protein [Isosphaeraceae bacterium]|nr:TlpA disulfide reductase family protein [Isosphaeraceae bacterium]